MTTTKERCFNIFAFIESGTEIVCEIGVFVRMIDGTDRDKIKKLQSMVGQDYRKCRRYPLPERCIVVHEDGSTTRRRISYKTLIGTQGIPEAQPLEEIYEQLRAGQSPMQVVTAIVDGKPLIEGHLSLQSE